MSKPESTPALDYVKRCTLCGATGHLAHACPWNRPSNGRAIRTWRGPEGLLHRLFKEGEDALVTVEVPLAVWQGLNKQGNGSDRLAAWTRARAWEDARLQALGHAVDGIAPHISAKRLDVPIRTIYRWRKTYLQKVQTAHTLVVPQETKDPDEP